MTTAKVAFSQKDYDKSIDFAQQEITKNPNNGEALLLLADAYLMKGNPKKAAEYANKADKVIKDPKLMQRPKLLINKIWVESFNNGVENFNRYYKTNQEKFLDSAIKDFEVGKLVRPQLLEFYNMTGQVYENKSDSISAMSEYQAYLEKAKPELGIFESKLLYLQMPRPDAIVKLGKPVSSVPFPTGGEDSLITDIYSLNGKDLYVFYKDNKKDNNFTLAGLRYDPPENWLPSEQSQWASFQTTPIASLAQYNYNHKKYTEALKYLKLLGSLEPQNTNVPAFMVDIYQSIGKMDEAYTYLNELLAKEPKNKYYLCQMGDIYQNDKKFTEAIDYYKKALDIDKYYDNALRNIASAYKNKASIRQKELKDIYDLDNTKKPNAEEYFPDLRESAKYFTTVSKSDKYNNDYKVYSELANIYFVLDDKAQLNNMLEKLETLDSSVPAEEKESYYLNMMKLYSMLKNSEKMEYYKNKLQ
ncbi:MAG: hypothetical protein A2X64_09055 [Ignavibacteria bacterium GWF2_33_9]|nr:MAG: hypothetical protein A2X64_09055 [Ignavibacteria bacterium GWF2_33_9]